MSANQKRGRGRPKTQKNNNVPVNFVVPEEIQPPAPEPKRSKKTAIEQLAETGSPVMLTPETQTEFVQLFGYGFAVKLFEHCEHDYNVVSAWAVVIQDYFTRNQTNVIPPNIFTDVYWDLSEENKVEMLNEAFKLQDDDAELDKVPEGEFRCAKCGCKRILVRLRQIRSSDEAMTQFLKCANKDCKKSWVIN
jgi:DNA-directed RNA polymerase subunit M/transcription elongation factor TFIIS